MVGAVIVSVDINPIMPFVRFKLVDRHLSMNIDPGTIVFAGIFGLWLCVTGVSGIYWRSGYFPRILPVICGFVVGLGFIIFDNNDRNLWDIFETMAGFAGVGMILMFALWAEFGRVRSTSK